MRVEIKIRVNVGRGWLVSVRAYYLGIIIYEPSFTYKNVLIGMINYTT